MAIAFCLSAIFNTVIDVNLSLGTRAIALLLSQINDKLLFERNFIKIVPADSIPFFRYANRQRPAWMYDRQQLNSRPFDLKRDRQLMNQIANFIQSKQ